jgi:superfamily II DNA/RNA helicase
MNSFNEMGLSASTVASLNAMNILVPTPIQAQTIPLTLGGKDVIGSAQTAAGKTLAFSIPLVERMLTSPDSTALVLVPTRELAQQVLVVVRQLLSNKPGIKTALLIGGDPIFNQLRQLRQNARVIVGTPGRVIDHLERGTYRPTTCNFLVLDEADRMVDMGFAPQIEEIIKQIPKERQTLMFSATLDSAINQVASRYLKSPERVVIGTTSTPSPTIHQEIMHILDSEKYDTLLKQLNERDGSIVIFVNTKVCADKLARKLTVEDHQRAVAIHGGLRQNKREKVLADFRNGKSRVMIATDVAARGLNIPLIQHVINYDVPLCPEDYIHRIGRTSRSGEKGFAVSIVTPRDGRKWQIIDRFMSQAMGGKTTHTQTRSPMLLVADTERQNSSLSSRSNGKRFSNDDSQRPHRAYSFRRNDEDGGRGGRSSGERSTSERSERSFSGERSERAPRRDYGDKPRFDRGGDKPRFDRDRGDKPYFDRDNKPHFVARGDNAATGEKKPFFSSDRSSGRSEGRSFDKPRFDREDRSQGDRPRFNREDRSREDRPRFDRAREDRPQGDYVARADGASDAPRSEAPRRSSFTFRKPGEEGRSFRPSASGEGRSFRKPFEGGSSERSGGFKRFGDKPRGPRDNASQGRSKFPFKKRRDGENTVSTPERTHDAN